MKKFLKALFVTPDTYMSRVEVNFLNSSTNDEERAYRMRLIKRGVFRNARFLCS